MRFRKSLAPSLAWPLGTLNASYVFTPLAEEMASAKTVFLATIIQADMGEDPAQMNDGAPFRVRYTVTVARRLKGDPSIETAWATRARFNDSPDD